MVIDTTGSSFELQLLIPTAGLLQTLNVLLDKLDEEIRDPAELDQTVTALTESLTAIPVVPDGETPKTCWIMPITFTRAIWAARTAQYSRNG